MSAAPITDKMRGKKIDSADDISSPPYTHFNIYSYDDDVWTKIWSFSPYLKCKM